MRKLNENAGGYQIVREFQGPDNWLVSRFDLTGKAAPAQGAEPVTFNSTAAAHKYICDILKHAYGAHDAVMHIKDDFYSEGLYFNYMSDGEYELMAVIPTGKYCEGVGYAEQFDLI